ncbi:trihelix transcription factor ASR3-like isoform X2 [Nicotiana tomentosiformis]|uniref:trihelix transcription factor ASR3-like isoform X2 n=1 Tax=Nicotiana tomentosiformis TaxID=4098 RepID=UPI00051C29E5|nr:trihelix transcription factor ASR3-like isoform X3 [Nicotiana tomentosiformis]
MDNILVGDQGGSSMLRDYRKGNWTVQETMVLIEAKKMDDERRNRRQGDINERGKPTELRWKWVEDYCWRNSCLRSQNQCNDKWDNLMRDFKKVREYERREAKKAAEVGEEITSYWKIEKNERKEKSLPTNMLPEIYEALVEIVDRKGQKMLPASLLPTLQQQSTQPQITALPLPPPPLPPPTTAVVAQTAAPQLSDVAYTGQYPFPTVDSPAKKRRMSGEGTSSGTAKGNINNSSQEVGSAISKSAVIIAEAIQSCEEREEKRHRELLSLHERRLKIEESKAEINREGINGLVDSINKLANSILALAGNKNQSAP